MTVMQAAAALVLWRSTRFDTNDIARLLSLSEADVVRLIDAARNRERPILYVIEGGTA